MYAIATTRGPTSSPGGDGFSEVGGDCDDNNDAIHPAASEVEGNGIDENCDGDSL